MTKRDNKKYRYWAVLFFILLAVLISEVWLDPGLLAKITERFPKIDPEGSLVVHYIDVGQGDSQLITTPDGKALLIDAGPNSSEDKLLMYLRSQDIGELEYAVFTHPHEDHIGGADMILKNFKVGHVLLPDMTFSSSTFLRMLEAVEESGTDLITAAAGQKYPLGEASFTVLGPVSGSYESVNDWSVVLRLDYLDTSFLFMGDAEKYSENEMMRKFDAREFRCDVIKAGHHGSSTSGSEAFLALCSPGFAVISCGRGNDYGHPHSETLGLLSEMGIGILRTDVLGTIVFRSDGIKAVHIK